MINWKYQTSNFPLILGKRYKYHSFLPFIKIRTLFFFLWNHYFFQISNVQHGLEQQYYRVEVLEKALAYREMSVDEREAMEAELEAIKKLLITNEKSLRKLQSENRQTVSVAGLFIFLCVAVFLIYTVLTNTN